jgi:hypothetical protein
MFAFLSNLGRLGVTIAVLVAVAGILGFTTLGMQLVASHHNAAATAGCSVSAAGVGSRLTISGTGYAANTSYLVEIKWPAGNTSGQISTTSASGALSAWNYAYYAGSYSVTVLTTGNNSTQVASCSTSV